MNAKSVPVVPDSLSLNEALRRSAPLVQLQQRIRDSNARFSAIKGLLPTALAARVKAGPVDEEGWTLLAANASVAAKLRQLQPQLEQTLKASGWQVSAVRIKVQSICGAQS